MPAYVTREQLETEIPPQHLADAVDDDAEGGADTDRFDTIAQQASDDVDGFLSSIYPTPFSEPVPAAVKAAAFVFCGERLYARRGVSADDNPFTKRANDWRDKLTKIGAGELPLDANIVKAFTPGAAITEAVSVNATTR